MECSGAIFNFRNIKECIIIFCRYFALTTADCIGTSIRLVLESSRVIYIYNYTWSISSHNVSQLNHWSLCLKKIQATFLFFHFFLNHCPNTSLFLSVSLYHHSWHFCPLNHTYKHKGWLFNPSLFLPNSTYFPCSSISPVKTLLVLNLHRQKIT